MADRNVDNLGSRGFDTFPPTQEKGNNDLKTLGRLAGRLDLGTKVQCKFGSVESWSTGKNSHNLAWWDLYCDSLKAHVTVSLMLNIVQAHESIVAWLMLAELLNARVVIFTTEVMEDT